MTTRRVLVVAPSSDVAETIIGWLSAAGYETIRVSDFAGAKAQLDLHPPDLLITELKLGAFNGLHLAIRARVSGAGTRTIVVGEPDRILEAEAQREGARYLTRPLDEDVFMDAVRESLGAYRPARRSPRKRVPRAEALVGEVHASLLDVSYEGLKIELPAAEGMSLPKYFTVRLPVFNVAARMRCVWISAPKPGVVWCGATLDTADLAASLAWRGVVDQMPGWTLLMN
jgi:DNA-binding response OmpR family regulator